MLHQIVSFCCKIYSTFSIFHSLFNQNNDDDDNNTIQVIYSCKCRLLLISSTLIESKIYYLRLTFFVLFENISREHHLLSCLPFKNV